MIVLDVRWLLFGLWLMLVSGTASIVWLAWRYRSERRSVLREILAVLSRATFGVLVMEEVCICRFANTAARHLLELPRSPARLPDAEWVQLLNEDRAAARRELVAIAVWPCRGNVSSAGG